MENAVRLNTRWSKSVKIISVLISIVILGGIIVISTALYDTGFNWIGVIMLPVLLLTFICTLISAPISVNITDNQIVIKKVIGAVKINRSDLMDVYPFFDEGSGIKLFGSGGLFGFTGIFKNKVGRYTAYVGDYDEAFYLVLKTNKIYMVSSENRDLAIETLKKTL